MRVVDGCKLTLSIVSRSNTVGHLALCVLTNLEVEEEGQRLTLVAVKRLEKSVQLWASNQ